MLDKSLPYFHVLMRRPVEAPLPEAPLPAGFRWRFFRAGDAANWAAIETSVLEFGSEAEARDYFEQRFMPHLPQLERRCLFIETDGGEAVGTCTAWWELTDERRDPWLHWLAVKPEYQGKGLGRALAARVTGLMLELEGARDCYLHTQTWSHRAIGIYESLGYRITGQSGLFKYANDEYQQALAVLRPLGRGLYDV